MSDLNSTRLRELLDYNPTTGVFTWRVNRRGPARIGAVAGRVNNGYCEVCVDMRRYLSHRLAWLYVHGNWPQGQIDHINGVRTDNRIENLRDVTVGENHQNKRRPQGANPYLGVTWHKGRQKWQAQIGVDGVKRVLGRFSTAEEARDAYLRAKRELHAGCTI